MKKVLTFVACLFLLTACGNSNPLVTDNTNHSLLLHDTEWRVFLPESWEVISRAGIENQSFLAMSANENLSIVVGHGWEEGSGEKHLSNIKKEFVVFEPVSDGATEWEFKAKKNAQTSLRYFYQRVIPKFDSTKFLLASCSYEVGYAEENCQSILSSIFEVIPEDKTTEEKPFSWWPF